MGEVPNEMREAVLLHLGCAKNKVVPTFANLTQEARRATGEWPAGGWNARRFNYPAHADPPLWTFHDPQWEGGYGYKETCSFKDLVMPYEGLREGLLFADVP